jgi:putative endopeptidase
MEALVSDLRTAMTVRIARLDWMSEATKLQALYKLSRFGVKIGYPSTWRDYSGLKLSPTDLYGNVVAAGKFNHAWSVAKLDRLADPAEWGMTPQTVNAYYHPIRNEIVFPAAILQPPFFDPAADPAVNYGAIGGVIGHEITHGFDDQGRKSDGDGVLRDWWTAEDAAKFEARTKALAAQYSAIELYPGAKVNGELTLGENIADLGGVLLALDAYRLSQGGRPAPVLDGITGEQRVFYGWAQVWRSVTREETARKLLVIDTHTPSPVRARAPVRNVDAWYQAFDVKPGDADYLPPEQRVRIW